jgi:hypothetical protein
MSGSSASEHRKLFCLFAFFYFLLLSCPSVFAEIHATQDVSGVYYHVDGNKERSFYPGNDADFLYEGSVDFKEKVSDGYDVFGSLAYRGTNDRLVDKQDASIERMFFGLKGNAQEYLAGDFYSSFSEYTLSNALKGGKIVLGDDKSSKLTLVGGVDISKWEDLLWETRREDSATARYVWGARLENKLLEEKLALAFNYGGANDDTARIATSASPISVNVFSVEGKYLLNEYITADSEIAQSFVDPDTRNNDAKIKADRAMKYGLDFNFQDYALSSVYSRVGNHFTTTGGFSSQDLEATSFDAVWYLPWKMKLNHYLHADKDNLSNTKTTTTKQLNPGAKLVLSLPMDIFWDLGADMRKRFSTDKSTNEKTFTYTSNLARDFRILYASFGYTKTVVTNRVSPAQERDADMCSLNLDGTLLVKNVKFSWNAGEDITVDHYEEVNKSDFFTASNLGLTARFPSSLTFTGKTSYGVNDYYLNESDSYTAMYFFSVSRDLIKDLVFDMSYERKAYRYYGNTNNYAENIIRGKFSYKF